MKKICVLLSFLIALSQTVFAGSTSVDIVENGSTQMAPQQACSII